MNEVFGTTVQVDIQLQGGLLSFVFILGTSSVLSPKEPGHGVSNGELHARHKGIDHHGLSQLVADDGVPINSEVIVRSIEEI